MKTGTMPRGEVEQWALAVLKVADTLSPDRLVRRGEVAEMCGVRAADADRIIEWARMVQHRDGPLPFITMPGAVRAMKNHRERYAAHFKALEKVQAERDAFAKARQRAQTATRRKRMSARDRAAAAIAKVEAAMAAEQVARDYTLDRDSAHLRPVSRNAPKVASIPGAACGDHARRTRYGFNLVLIALATGKYKALTEADLTRVAEVSLATLAYMVHRGLIVPARGGGYLMTVAGLVYHVISSGPECWRRPTATIAAWHVILRRIGEGHRRMDQIIHKNSAKIIPRYQRQMTRAGLIRVKDGNAYLTEYGWQWARMDLTTQG